MRILPLPAFSTLSLLPNLSFLKLLHTINLYINVQVVVDDCSDAIRLLYMGLQECDGKNHGNALHLVEILWALMMIKAHC